MRIEYDSEADAIYIRISDWKIVRTVEAGTGANLDFDAEENIIGGEVFEASRGVSGRVLKELARI